MQKLSLIKKKLHKFKKKQLFINPKMLDRKRRLAKLRYMRRKLLMRALVDNIKYSFVRRKFLQRYFIVKPRSLYYKRILNRRFVRPQRVIFKRVVKIRRKKGRKRRFLRKIFKSKNIALKNRKSWIISIRVFESMFPFLYEGGTIHDISSFIPEFYQNHVTYQQSFEIVEKWFWLEVKKQMEKFKIKEEEVDKEEIRFDLHKKIIHGALTKVVKRFTFKRKPVFVLSKDVNKWYNSSL